MTSLAPLVWFRDFVFSCLRDLPHRKVLRISVLPTYRFRCALSEMSFRHQAPGQRMHFTAR